MTADLLKQGIAALKAGRKEEARNILMQVVKQDERNEMAWLWLSGTVDTDKERRTCLETVLSINPNNTAAKRGLQHLGASVDARLARKRSLPTPSVESVEPSSDQSLPALKATQASSTASDLELPSSEVERVPAEGVYFSDGTVHVTSRRVVIDGKTFAMGHITAVDLAQEPANRVWGYFFIVLGLIFGLDVLFVFVFLGLSYIGSSTVVAMFATGFFIILGIIRIRGAKPKYTIQFVTSAGEISAMTTPDREYAMRIMNALNQAIVGHPASATH